MSHQYNQVDKDLRQNTYGECMQDCISNGGHCYECSPPCKDLYPDTFDPFYCAPLGSHPFYGPQSPYITQPSYSLPLNPQPLPPGPYYMQQPFYSQPYHNPSFFYPSQY